MNLSVWQIDAGIALVAALILIFVTPGLAITALVALLVLLACGISLVVGRVRRRRRDARRQAQRPRSRSPLSR